MAAARRPAARINLLVKSAPTITRQSTTTIAMREGARRNENTGML
jgi:hypothetical protein